MGRFYYVLFEDCIVRGFRVTDEHPLQWLRRQPSFLKTKLLFFAEIPEEEYMSWNNDGERENR